MRTMRRPTLLLFAALLVASLTACPGELDDPARFLGGSCADVETEFFPQRCGTAGCHNASDAASAGNLDLASDDVASRVVGVLSTSACGSNPLVNPSDPESSVIYNKMTDDHCGAAQMPLGGAEVSAAELACVRDWIASLSPTGGSGSGGDSSGGAGPAGSGGASAGGGADGGAGGG